MSDELAIFCCKRLPENTILVPLDVLYCSGRIGSELNVLASPDGAVHCSSDLYESLTDFSSRSLTGLN